VGHVFPDWKGSTNPTWAKGDFWAPDLQVVNGRIACYFSAKAPGGILGGSIYSLGVAFAENITGPFVDSGKVLWEDKSNAFGTIDVHMHETSEGEKYLVWKKNQNVAHLQVSAHLMIQRLTDDGAALSDDAALAIVSADQKWEKYGCVEAPWILERNGTFYLFYSGSMVNFNSYAVGVARADAITGPYIKRPEPVIHGCDYSPPKAEARFLEESAAFAESEIVYTPGHCSVLPVHGDDDRWVIFYHGRDNNGDKDHRVLMMDELTWGEDGWPHVVGDCPSSTSVPVPGSTGHVV
jgi:beta-xylosidase